MDVSNLTTKNAPTTPVVSTSKSAVQGNPLPGVGQLNARLEKISVNTPQSPEPLTPSSEASPPSATELRELVSQANKSLQASVSDLKFSVDETTNINIVRVEDSETGELIRQFPSEAMVAIARALEDMQQGSVFEEKA